jgi:hypothetical protein
MSIDEMKNAWMQQGSDTKGAGYDQASFEKLVRSRVKKHTGTAFKYFWAAFVLQIMVYAMLSHLIVKYWYDPLITLPGLAGIAIFIPFTAIMMRKFKSVGSTNADPSSMSIYIERRRDLLESFYRFKKRYELILIPLATFIGTFLVFELYVPGGIWVYPKGALITFFVSLASCIIAIQAENKRNFEEPLAKLTMIVDELNEGR